MYGRPDHRVGVAAINMGCVFTAVGGSRTLACDPNQVYLITVRKGLRERTSNGPPLSLWRAKRTTVTPPLHIFPQVNDSRMAFRRLRERTPEAVRWVDT
eukprot:6136011-Prymnesium_polylepis.1